MCLPSVFDSLEILEILEILASADSVESVDSADSAESAESAVQAAEQEHLARSCSAMCVTSRRHAFCCVGNQMTVPAIDIYVNIDRVGATVLSSMTKFCLSRAEGREEREERERETGREPDD